MPDSHQKIPVAISSCLLGKSVRYDGGHCYEQHIVKRLETIFDLIPVCPEMEIGLGAPRTPIQLVKTDQGIRVRRADDPEFDVTTELVQLAKSTALQLNRICGYIFKAHSPSCGINNTKTFDQNNQLLNTEGTGMFAATIIKALPGLPVANETRLQDTQDIEQFISRVNHYHASRP
ncbi:MAG: DUF523 domain-containing protein [Gammaproteobacteria bacterium]|nr:DUF523 domain-containing protein [Gammaproteobacteria bacterium]